MKLENLKLLLLTNNQILLTQIEEVTTELGEPDCKLIEPFLLDQSNLSLSPWLVDYSTQNTFMIHSDKILTIADPNSKLRDKYEDLVK
jgi:hypothetical protein